MLFASTPKGAGTNGLLKLKRARTGLSNHKSGIFAAFLNEAGRFSNFCSAHSPKSVLADKEQPDNCPSGPVERELLIGCRIALRFYRVQGLSPK